MEIYNRSYSWAVLASAINPVLFCFNFIFPDFDMVRVYTAHWRHLFWIYSSIFSAEHSASNSLLIPPVFTADIDIGHFSNKQMLL